MWLNALQGLRLGRKLPARLFCLAAMAALLAACGSSSAADQAGKPIPAWG